MEASSGCILAVGQQLQAAQVADLIGNPSLTKCLSSIATSPPAQAVDSAMTKRPHLVILFGDEQQAWSLQVARQIKQSIQPSNVTVVALMDSIEQSWDAAVDSAIDGCFVRPMSPNIFNALDMFARLKQAATSQLLPHSKNLYLI